MRKENWVLLSFTAVTLLCFQYSFTAYGAGAQYGAGTQCAEGTQYAEGTENIPAPGSFGEITDFNVPGGILLGLYSWNGDLLAYYMEDGQHKLCRMDSQSGEILSCTKQGYSQGLVLEMCENHLPEGKNNRTESVNHLPEEKNHLSEPEQEKAVSGNAGNDSLEELNKELLGELLPKNENEDDIYIEDGIFGETEAKEEEAGQDQKKAEPGLADEGGELLRVFIGAENKFQWLDQEFQVVFEYSLNQEISGQPLMDSENRFLYYVNLNGEVIRQDFSTGEEIVLEAGGPFYSPPYLEGIYNNGTIAVVSGNFMEKGSDGVSENIRFCKNYIDTADNELLATTESFGTLTGDGSQFYVSMLGGLNQAVFGSFLYPDQKWEFIFDNYEEYDNLYAWPENDRLLTFHTQYAADGGARELCFVYSFESGQKVAASEIVLDSGNGGYSPRPDYACYIAENETVVFHLNSQPGKIFAWNIQGAEPKRSQKSFKEAYLLPDSEDLEIMEDLKTQAKALGEKYGVEIYVGQDCPKQLSGYQTEPALSAAKCRRALIFLEQALEKYPEGFFKQLEESNGEILKFYLVKRLIPDGNDSLSSTVGLYGGSAGQYIALSIDSPKELKTLIFHEITHAIDYKVSGAADQNYENWEWSARNPYGFTYAKSYRANAADTSWEYVFNGTGDNENAYFVDQYSKSFPTEDRARIMEKAMGLFPETAFFTAPHIEEKLSYISKAIRENFDTNGWPEVLWWERPLSED